MCTARCFGKTIGAAGAGAAGALASAKSGGAPARAGAKSGAALPEESAAGALGGANKGGAPAALGCAAGFRSAERVEKLVDNCAGGGWAWQLKNRDCSNP